MPSRREWRSWEGVGEREITNGHKEIIWVNGYVHDFGLIFSSTSVELLKNNDNLND